MKMSSNGDWNNRPRAREELSKKQISSSQIIAVVFGIVAFVSVAGLLVMFVAHILHDAGAIGWSLSYRQAQLLTLCVYVLDSMFRFVHKRENTPTL